MRTSRSAWWLSKGMRKSSRKAEREGEHLLLPQPQPLQQIARRRLLHPSALARASLGRWIGGMPGGEQRAVARDERLAEDGGQGAQTVGARLFDGDFHLSPHRLQLLGPRLLELFLEEGQFP